MPRLRLDDREFELKPGEVPLGTDEDAHVRLDTKSATGTLAIISVGSTGTADVRRAARATVVVVNGGRVREPRLVQRGDVARLGHEELRLHRDLVTGAPPLAALTTVDNRAGRGRESPARSRDLSPGGRGAAATPDIRRPVSPLVWMAAAAAIGAAVLFALQDR